MDSPSNAGPYCKEEVRPATFTEVQCYINVALRKAPYSNYGVTKRFKFNLYTGAGEKVAYQCFRTRQIILDEVIIKPEYEDLFTVYRKDIGGEWQWLGEYNQAYADKLTAEANAPKKEAVENEETSEKTLKVSDEIELDLD